MKLISWNVNGLRAILKKGFHDFLEIQDPDILCLQEIKISEDLIPRFELPYPHAYFNCAEKKGYSGTAILSKEEPLKVSFDITPACHQTEGRVITAEYQDFFLVNVYTPNSQSELKRLTYREQQWDPDFRSHVQELALTKPVIICGDLNVAHQEIDLANPKTNRNSAGFTDEERHGLSQLLDAGFADIFREHHPDEPEHYSWWSYRANARERNVGWRIDYVLVSSNIQAKVTNAFILPEVHGSDHAPVGVTLQ
tara:strand:+ start:46914 stop:47672 length:759 start_codon:yes stop_codon:yes gene_type:complete